jgi:hypothetical protein
MEAELLIAQGRLAEAEPMLERAPLDGRDPQMFRPRIRLWMLARRYAKQSPHRAL